MRVAYLINQYPKVSHTFIRREILALERLGVDINRIALRGWDEKPTDPADRLEQQQTRYVLRDGGGPLALAFLRAAATRPGRFAKAVGAAWRMSRRSERPFPIHLVYLAEAARVLSWLDEAKVEHLHAHFGTNAAEVAMLVGILGGPRWSFTVHGPEEFDKAPMLHLAEKVRHAAFVVAISSYGRSQLYRLLEVEEWPKVHVIHCGLDETFLDAPATSIPEAPRLVCVGRLCEQKGQLLLIEAARRLMEEGVDFELVLAGDGELRPQIEARIAEYGLTGRVRITGWLSSAEVREEILAARALVLPSFAEGLPVVIMEAMALGRPVISTYVAGIPELVINGEHGWLVPAGNVEALVGAMREGLKAPEASFGNLSGKARQQVLERHGSEHAARSLINAILDKCEKELNPLSLRSSPSPFD